MSPAEIAGFVTAFVSKGADRAWLGVCLAPCAAVRALSVSNSETRAVGVYDTAEPDDAFHAELFVTEHVIDEADLLEVKKKLWDLFGAGAPVTPATYRGGAPFAAL